MAQIGRQTIVFFLPLDLSAFTSEYTPYSESVEGSSPHKRVQLYLNPESFDINDAKIIQSKQTKGGFLVQYWGEALTNITMMGTTGSSGVEGINILREVYRHEQIRLRELLAERQRAIAENAIQSASEAALMAQERTGVGGTLTNIADLATGGAWSQAVSGISNAVDIITDPFAASGQGAVDRKSFGSYPTMGALATGVDMFYQGEYFRGYFKSLNVKENSEKQGTFSYTMQYVVTRRTGRRENFMAWHRSPTEYDGTARMAAPSTVSKGLYPEVNYLSFPVETDNSGAYVYKNAAMYNVQEDPNIPSRSEFGESKQAERPEGDVGINRRKKSTEGS